MRLPVRVEGLDFLVDADHELICRLDATTRQERETIVAALNLLPVARDLIAEAMDNHVYNEANGEGPADDCAYAQFMKDADRAL